MKTQFRKTKLVLCGMVACGIFAGLQSARAAADATENFDYSDGPLLGLNGGSGWAGAWFNDSGPGNATITATEGKLQFITAGTNAVTSDIYRQLASPINSGTAYLSIRMQSLNGGLRYFGVAPFSDGNLLFGSGSTLTNWAINRVTIGTNTNTSLESSIPTTVESLLVLKVEFDAAAGGVNELVTFWVNPNESIPVWELDVADAVGGQVYETSMNWGSLSGLRVNAGGYKTSYTPGFTDFTMDDVQIIRESVMVGDVAISPLPGTNAVTLTWATSSDTFSYTVEKKTKLTDATWNPSLTDIPGNNGNVTVTTAVDQVESFYRVTGE